QPIAVMMDRGEIYRRCDARLDSMLAHGAIDEARAVTSLGLDPALPAMRAVGLPQLLAYVRREMPLDEAAAAAKKATRHYVKRQFTWIRRNFHEWNTYDAQLLERTKQDLKILVENHLTAAF